MQAYLTLTRRELGSFFYSWIGYVVIAGAVFLMGLSFVILLGRLAGQPTMIPITEMFLSLCFWLILLFSAPIITMRLFALEKFSGTFETLMTAPVSDAGVVLAKFTAALIFYMLMWLPLLGCLFILRYFTRGTNLTEPGTLASTFLGIFLVGSLYMAAGCFASALTRSQIVAAMISFALGLALFLAGYLGEPIGAGQDVAGGGVEPHRDPGADEGLRQRGCGHPPCGVLFDINHLLPVPDLPGGGKPPLEMT